MTELSAEQSHLFREMYGLNPTALRRPFQDAVQLVQQSQHVVLIFIGEVVQAFDNTADAFILVIQQGLFSRRSEDDVDLALVAGIDAALDERPFAVFQRADDARHLCRQHTEEALDFAHDHGALSMEKREGEELDFLEVAAAASAAQAGQADVRDHFKQVLGDIFDPVSGADGHGLLSRCRVRSVSGPACEVIKELLARKGNAPFLFIITVDTCMSTVTW